jgi:hypothetical protein
MLEKEALEAMGYFRARFPTRICRKGHRSVTNINRQIKEKMGVCVL